MLYLCCLTAVESTNYMPKSITWYFLCDLLEIKRFLRHDRFVVTRSFFCDFIFTRMLFQWPLSPEDVTWPVTKRRTVQKVFLQVSIAIPSTCYNVRDTFKSEWNSQPDKILLNRCQTGESSDMCRLIYIYTVHTLSPSIQPAGTFLHCYFLQLARKVPFANSCWDDTVNDCGSLRRKFHTVDTCCCSSKR